MAIICRETGCKPDHIGKKGCGHKLYYRFKFAGEEYKECTQKTNYREAEEVEWTLRKKLQEDAYNRKWHPERVNDRPSEPIPSLAEFARIPEGNDRGGMWWWKHATERHKKANTANFYACRVRSLLSYPKLAASRLDQIDRSLIDEYIAARLAEGVIGPSTINQDVQQLRALLHKAQLWKLLTALPEFPGRGEKLEVQERGLAIEKEEEEIYFRVLAAHGYIDLRDLASLAVDSGVEPGKVLVDRFDWSMVHLGPHKKLRYGYIFDPFTKRPSRQRNIPIMTRRLYQVLDERWKGMGCPTSGRVFPGWGHRNAQPVAYSTLGRQHKKLWDDGILKIRYFRLYDLRHTFLTRSGEAGVSTRGMKIVAGWTSEKMAEKYLHKNVRQLAEYQRQVESYMEEEGIIAAD